MRIDTSSVSLHLKPRQIVALPEVRAGGVSVSVRAGSVWLTQDRDQADIVLEPGQTHASHGRGQILLYGLSEAEVDIVEADALAA